MDHREKSLRATRIAGRGAERVWVQQLPAQHYNAGLPQIANTRGRVAFNEHQIGVLADRNRAGVVVLTHKARGHDGPVLIDFRVEQEDSVYPMVPAGKALHEMIRRPSAIVETAADE